MRAEDGDVNIEPADTLPSSRRRCGPWLYAAGRVRRKRPSPRSLGGGGVSCRGYPSGATGQPGTAVEMRAPVKYLQEALPG